MTTRIETICTACGRDIYCGEEFYDIAVGQAVRGRKRNRQLSVCCIAAYCLECVDQYELTCFEIEPRGPLPPPEFPLLSGQNCMFCERTIAVGEEFWTLWLNKYDEDPFTYPPLQRLAGFCMCPACESKMDAMGTRLYPKPIACAGNPKRDKVRYALSFD